MAAQQRRDRDSDRLPRQPVDSVILLDGRELAAEMSAQGRTLVRIDTQLGALASAVDSDKKQTSGTLVDIKRRLTAVEQRVWQIPSASLVLATASLVFGIVMAVRGG